MTLSPKWLLVGVCVCMLAETRLASAKSPAPVRLSPSAAEVLTRNGPSPVYIAPGKVAPPWPATIKLTEPSPKTASAPKLATRVNFRQTVRAPPPAARSQGEISLAPIITPAEAARLRR